MRDKGVVGKRKSNPRKAQGMVNIHPKWNEENKRVVDRVVMYPQESVLTLAEVNGKW